MILEKKFDKLELEKVKNPSNDDLSLILEGINLAADASNDSKWTMQDLKKYLEVKPNIFFIKKGEEKIGVVFLGIDGGYNEIGNFAIFKKYQAKGYGLQALKVVIDYLRKLYPGRDIEIGVAERNTKAVNLYKKVGFKITKTGEEKSGRFYKMTFDSKQKFRTYRLLKRAEDGSWAIQITQPYNYIERCPSEEEPHVYDDWAYMATTDLDPANAVVYVDILTRAMLKRKAEEIHRIKRRLIREEAEYKEMRRDFSSLDKLVAEVVEES